jgi:hypothetical protein
MIAPMPPEPACVIVTVTVPPGATDRGEIDLLALGPSWAATALKLNIPTNTASAANVTRASIFLNKTSLPLVPFASAL